MRAAARRNSKDRSRSVRSTALETRVHFMAALPRPDVLGDGCVVLFDGILKKANPKFRAWLKAFPAALALEAGEELKALEEFPANVHRIVRAIAKLPGGRAKKVVAVGGGSIGDFAGLFASLYHRGIELVHFPSTWLAAVDSAHGGKTALNVGGTKNQLGTFYPASDVFIVESLLTSQPAARALEANAELLKIALIDGGPWVEEMFASELTGAELLWRFLPEAVQSKYTIVDQDPREKSGLRALLNLGHTLGHVLEAHHGLAHGSAVACGLHFAVDWSKRRGYLRPKDHLRIKALLERHLPISTVAPELVGAGAKRRAVPRRRFLDAAIRDKKKAQAGRIRFIFLKKVGVAAPIEVTLEEFFEEAEAAGWTA